MVLMRKEKESMDDSVRKYGGSKSSTWYGNLLTRIGNYYIRRGSKFIDKGSIKTVSNPSCKLINPFTLILTFTVNNTEKYQLIVQGDYKERYKQSGSEDNPIPPDEMFNIILSKRKNWFLKS